MGKPRLSPEKRAEQNKENVRRTRALQKSLKLHWGDSPLDEGSDPYPTTQYGDNRLRSNLGNGGAHKPMRLPRS